MSYYEKAKSNLTALCGEYIEKEITSSLAMAVAGPAEGQTLFEFYGGSELPEGMGLRVEEDTLFHVASVTKIITSTLAAMLIERGRLTMQDAVRAYLPDFPHEDVGVYHLLTHTAGFAGGIGLECPASPELDEKIWRQFCALPRKYTPGKGMEYLSYYYIVLGKIIERITGTDLQTFAAAELFGPLGMERTGYGIDSAKGAPFLQYYSQTLGRFGVAPIAPKPLGDAGLLTTPRELVRIGQLLLHKGSYQGERVFSPATADFLLRECTGGIFGRTPAFFTRINPSAPSILPENASPAAVAHHGMTGSILFIDPAYEICAAITTNSERMHSDGRHYQRLLAAALTLA